MRIECIKHGDVEGVRNAEGKLRCPTCLAEKQSQSKEANDEAKRRAAAKDLVEKLFSPERMEAHRRKREAEVMSMVEDALVNQLKHEQRKRERN